MQPVRFDYGALYAGGAGVLPRETEGVDFLLLDGGPLLAPDRQGPEAVLEEAFDRLGPRFFLDPGLNVIASLAGREPRKAARSIAKRLVKTSNFDLPISVVRGHDLMGELEVFLREHSLANATSGRRFADLLDPTEVAVACLGREPMVAALTQDARVVLVGYESPGDMAAAAARYWFGEQAGKGSLDEAASQVGVSLSAVHCVARPRAALDDPFYTSNVSSVLLTQDAQIDGADLPLPQSLQSESYWAREHELNDPTQSRVTILCRRAFVLEAVLYLSHESALDELYTVLTESKAWGSDAPDLSVCSSEDATGEVIIRVTMRHAEHAVVQQAAALLGQIAGAFADQGVFLLAPPTVTAVHEAWPTWLPTESLEWSIDTRTAREWVD